MSSILHAKLGKRWIPSRTGLICSPWLVFNLWYSMKDEIVEEAYLMVDKTLTKA